MLPLLTALAATGTIYGVSMSSSLVSIDLTSGKMTAVGVSAPEELYAQELSAIDSLRGRYYTAGVNATTHKVNLCVWSLKGGYKVTCRDLPFESSVFVGTGQALNVDPNDGTIIVMGHDPTRGGHHAIYTLDPDTFKPTFVADIGGDMHFDMLGASTTYDHDEKTVYVITSYNGTNPSSLKANVKGPPPPAPKVNISFSAIELTTGKVTNLTKDLIMGGFVYDSKTKRVYGTHVTQSNGESVDARDAAVWRGRNGKKTALNPNGLTRKLAYFETKKRDQLHSVTPLDLSMAVGDVHFFDKANRVHYTLLLGKGNSSNPYTHTDYCSKHGNECPTGSACCKDPQSKIDYGYCYSVDDCSKIPAGGDPLKVPAYAVGVNLDSGTAVVSAPLCSLEPGPTTSPNRCPWSIEAA